MVSLETGTVSTYLEEERKACVYLLFLKHILSDDPDLQSISPGRRIIVGRHGRLIEVIGDPVLQFYRVDQEYATGL